MKRLILCALSLLTLAAACKKEEFQQEPYGDKVPFTDSATHDLRTLVSLSAAHKLFYAAWQRSNADAMIRTQGVGELTVFAPDDAAMRAAGYNEAAIAAAAATDIDSLVLFHIMGTKLDSVSVAPMKISNSINTLLTHQTLQEYLMVIDHSIPSWRPYRFRQFVCMKDGHLILNGKDAGDAKIMKATNGILWPINHVTQRPHEHMMDVLARDPRFSMLHRLVRETDSLWPIITEYFAGDHTFFNLLYPVQGVNVTNDLFFAPTNEAFAKSGFNSYEELWALNERSMPYFDWDWFELRNGDFVTDSLLAYHLWGRKYAPTGGWGPGVGVGGMFFARDLKNELIGDFEVVARNSLGPVPAYINPLEFGNEGGQVTVKVKGLNKTPAKIIESDIYTYEGPLHVVDHLILSDKVKF